MFTRLILILLLMWPVASRAQEITAIGIVEGNKDIRLAFVRTDLHWKSSCFFSVTPQLPNDSHCAHNVMAWPWEIINLEGKYIDIGPLVPIKYRYYSEVGLVSFKLPQGVELKFPQKAKPRYTWGGESPWPLLAVPSGTTLTTLSSEPAAQPNEKIRAELIRLYFEKKRFIYTCRLKPDYQEHERAAVSSDVIVTPLRQYPGAVIFYKVSLKLPANSHCDVVDSESELMAVKGQTIINLTKPFREYVGAFSTSLSLFDGFKVSTKKTGDTVYIMYIGGYDLDGYALVDSELNILAKSIWAYH